MKTEEKNWNAVLEQLHEFFEEVAYNAWMSGLKIVHHDKNTEQIFVVVDNETIKVHLEERYRNKIEKCVASVFGDNTNIVFLLPSDADRLYNKSKKTTTSMFRAENMLNPRFTFDTFVVGDNSRFAQAAALAVAEAPGRAYNPLFIYGGSGLGKTHLMHALGHYIIDHYPDLRVLYVSSEMFTNEYITASQSPTNNAMNDFKAKYRSIDILMIDDIQFISGKEKTIEEVFNTYNFLYNNGKQLVFSSDRPPKDLLGLDDRLISRLSSGLLVDIQPPAYEIKVAILRNKAILDGIDLTDGLQEVINIIAEKIKTNVRDMEGAFNSVVAYGTLVGIPINKAMARNVLRDVISSKDIQPTPEIIKKTVAQKYGITVDDLNSSKRARNFSNPRQIAMYLCREMTDYSLPKIGEFFGNRDHTTVLHAIDKINTEKTTNDNLNDIINELEDKIRNK